MDGRRENAAWAAMRSLESLSSEIGAVTGHLALASTASGAGAAPAAPAPSPDARAAAPSPSRAAGGDAALDQRVRDMCETSERVMAQNIALLGEVEAMQREIASLRASKAALARRARLLMEAQERSHAAV
ncbi:hypothetical protein FNF27_06757 [Cafeteria roenbergensis]|uniref:Uncharacterized protein n=1 Tax=Cafeteria roenbergensis TaxID=33653 RepID=A0A5A8CMB8_CAFRO|nr:hypothetical protein FNF29_02992 [Cafeteria roenbergensis]KAA0158985.1 hypothetical protein FNF28_06034 [Cafeteria roenbergensis]KAA0170004.1 hypothetical protein FNF27_06757 [Cafeteria roenbergensis]|eukprot:KAA0153604.1 hypothetical protein FNF29_02992 [Cafeteria roenbergensis]